MTTHFPHFYSLKEARAIKSRYGNSKSEPKNMVYGIFPHLNSSNRYTDAVKISLAINVFAKLRLSWNLFFNGFHHCLLNAHRG